MKKRSRLVAALLSAVLLAGSLLTMPLSVGAVTAVSDGTVSGKVWQDVKFSDILTADMTSSQIADKLAEVGISKRSGNVTYSFENGKLVISASAAAYIDLARDSSLKSADTVETSLGGVVLSTPAPLTTDNKTQWSYMVISGANANCYKIQLRAAANSKGEYIYTPDPGIRVDDSTKSGFLLAGSSSVNAKTPMELTVSADRNYGIYSYIDGNLLTTMKNATATFTDWQGYADKVMNDFIQLGINAGVTIELESVRIRERMPELTITEVMTNGVTAVEVYNSTLNPVNIYDHCLYVAQTNGVSAYWQANSNGGAVGSKWGTLTETIAYPVAGAYTYNYTEPTGKDGTAPANPADATVAGYENSVTLTNPAYEEGVLNPGECAVLYIPTHAIGKSTLVAPKTLENFKSEYGITSKVFYCYSNRDLAIGEKNGYAQIGLGRVTFEGGDKSKPTVAGTTFMRNQPAAPAIRSSDYGIYDSFVTVNTTKDTKTLRAVKYESTGNTAESSVEFLTAGRLGNVLYKSGETRKVDGTEKLHSLGTVLDEQKLTFTSTVTDVFGRVSRVSLGIGETRALPVLEGAEWKNAVGETVTAIAANTESSYTQTTDLTAVFCGTQATTKLTDGTYSVRLVAVLKSLDFDAVGFEATVTWGDGKTRTVTGTCRYAYTSIVGDGETYAAADFGGDYFVVLHVDGIPAEVAAAEWNVRVWTVSGETRSDGIGGSGTVEAPKA